MNKKEIKPSVNGNANQSGVPPGNALSDRKTVLTAKRPETVAAVPAIAVVCLIGVVIYMCTIPLPTDFSKMNLFEFN